MFSTDVAMTVNIKQSERWGWVEKYMDLEEFQVTQDEVNLAYKFYEVPCCSYETEKHPALNCRSNIACVRNLGQAKLEFTEEAVAGKKRKAGGFLIDTFYLSGICAC